MKSRFKQLRQDAGLTQEEFRIQFNNKYHRNYTPSAISRFENDKRIPETMALMDFADFFGVTVDYLLGRDTPAPQISNETLSKDKDYNDSSFGIAIKNDILLIDDTEIHLHAKTADKLKKAIGIALYDELEAAKEKSQASSTPAATEANATKRQQELFYLKKNILLIDGLHCSEIKSVDVRADNIAHILRIPLITDMLDEQDKDLKTYLVPEMFHMEAFYDSLRNSLLHYSAAPEITIGNFKSKCQEFSQELRAFEYTKTMSASAEQLENYSSFTYLGIKYCRINNDIYRIEKDGPGRYILTKQARPTYDPTPKEKKKESTHYRYAA